MGTVLVCQSADRKKYRKSHASGFLHILRCLLSLKRSPAPIKRPAALFDRPQKSLLRNTRRCLPGTKLCAPTARRNKKPHASTAKGSAWGFCMLKIRAPLSKGRRAPPGTAHYGPITAHTYSAKRSGPQHKSVFFHRRIRYTQLDKSKFQEMTRYEDSLCGNVGSGFDLCGRGRMLSPCGSGSKRILCRKDPILRQPFLAHV